MPSINRPITTKHGLSQSRPVGKTRNLVESLKLLKKRVFAIKKNRKTQKQREEQKEINKDPSTTLVHQVGNIKNTINNATAFKDPSGLIEKKKPQEITPSEVKARSRALKSSKKSERKSYQNQHNLYVNKSSIATIFRGYLNFWQKKVPLDSLSFPPIQAAKKKIPHEPYSSFQVAEEANEKLSLAISVIMDSVLEGAGRFMWEDGRVTLEPKDLLKSVKCIMSNNPKLKIFEYLADEFSQ